MFENVIIAWMFIYSTFLVRKRISTCVRTTNIRADATEANSFTKVKKHTCVVLSFNLMSIVGSGNHLCCRSWRRFCFSTVY